MIQRERIADNVYLFQSDIYAQVTAGAVIGPEWAVVIDTLALSEETLVIRDFIEQEINVPIRYVINTHSHADHAWGNYLFHGATVIAHALCREFLDTAGRESLQEIQARDRAFKNIKIVLPQMTFEEGEISLQVGKKTLTIFSLPGSSADNVAIHIKEDRLLFAGDAAMPIPYIVDGNSEELIVSLKKIGKIGLENVVQGHGDIVLRGEIENLVLDNQAYLACIRRVVRRSARRKYPREVLDVSNVEDCGKSRVLLGGLAPELHHRNLLALYRQLYGEPPRAPGEDDFYSI